MASKVYFSNYVGKWTSTIVLKDGTNICLDIAKTKSGWVVGTVAHRQFTSLKGSFRTLKEAKEHIKGVALVMDHYLEHYAGMDNGGLR